MSSPAPMLAAKPMLKVPARSYRFNGLAPPPPPPLGADGEQPRSVGAPSVRATVHRIGRLDRNPTTQTKLNTWLSHVNAT